MYLESKHLVVNGVQRELIYDPEKDSLADVLRRFGLTGVKVGCGTGVCGACSVLLNGSVVRSCTRKMDAVAAYSVVTTIEGIGTPVHLHPIQAAWMSYGAVQCGFCTPGFIVSAYGLLQENVSPTREEVRDWFQKHRNVCRCTGYKQLVDAVMAAAEIMRGEKTIDEMMARNTGGYAYGKPLIRPAALAKVCGLADYGDDMELKMPEGTLHAVVVQPKITSHGRIKAIHSEEAQAMPGVVKVVTAKDVQGSNRLHLVAATKRSKTVKPSHVLFCDEKISHYGDVVAAVVADTKRNARAAAAKVRVEIEELPAYLNYLDAVMPDALRIHEDHPNILTVAPVVKGAGDENPRLVSEIIDNSTSVVEGSFYASREPHLSVEGDTVQAYYDKDGNMVVRCKTQNVGHHVQNIAYAIGLPPEKVRVIMNHTGGSFGWSYNPSSFALAAACSMAVNAPVALSMTYEEYMHYSGKRSPAYINARVGCDKNGKLTGVEFEFGIDHGAYNENEQIVMRPIRFMLYPYTIPHVAGLARSANTNHSFGIAYRGYGSPQTYTAGEALMDMLAEKAGLDPFEFRWRNIARPGDTNTNSFPYREYPMEEIMTKLKPLYEDYAKEAQERDTPQLRCGIGIAWGGYNVSYGIPDTCSVALELNPDNTFTKYDTWQDLGQGGDIGSLMVTLEALKPLGIQREQVRLVQNDSKFCPISGPSAASRMHYMDSGATKMAADQLLDAMRKPDGSYRTYEEMKAAGLETKVVATYTNRGANLVGLDPNTGHGDPCPAYNYILTLAMVTVDVKTGKAAVVKYAAVDDVGVIGNIDAVNGQAYGGISHCIGYALTEEYEDVKAHTNMYKAGVPYIKDIPDDITLIHCENKRELNPFGSSGCSEAYQSAGHMAVINAIYNACGVRIFELPARPEKIKAGLDILAAGGKIEGPAKFYLGADLMEELEEIMANPV